MNSKLQIGIMETRPHLLIADDQPENLLILDDLLNENYEVHTVENGERVFDFFAGGGKADLILLDGNPLDGYWNMLNTKLVLKGGVIVVDKR